MTPDPFCASVSTCSSSDSSLDPAANGGGSPPKRSILRLARLSSARRKSSRTHDEARRVAKARELKEEVSGAAKGLVGLGGGVVASGCVGLGARHCCAASAPSSPSLKSCMSVRTLNESLSSIDGGNDDSVRSLGSSRSGGSVSFHSLILREFPLCLSDYPHCCGPAIGMGWDPVGPDRRVSLEDYEAARQRPVEGGGGEGRSRRRRLGDLQMTTFQRWHCLTERGGYTRKEIKDEMWKIEKARKVEAKRIAKLKKKYCERDEQDGDDDATGRSSSTSKILQARRCSFETMKIQALAGEESSEQRDDEPQERRSSLPSFPQRRRSSLSFRRSSFVGRILPENESNKRDDTAITGQERETRRRSMTSRHHRGSPSLL